VVTSSLLDNGAGEITGTDKLDNLSSGFSGSVRLGKRTKHLVKRLRVGEIAIIDHLDLDRVSGEDLVACSIKAVINCSPSSSGNYPNMGPQLLLEAGIALIDVSPELGLFDLLKDGEVIEITGNKILRAGKLLTEGHRYTLAEVKDQTGQRRQQIGNALEQFARNTVEYMAAESELLAENLELPNFETEFRDRPVLVVVRGVDHKRDLKVLRPYIRDRNPVLVGVDGGADAIIEEGFKPDMIVGDMDSATEKALRCGAELVVHAFPDGRAPGKGLLDELKLSYKIVPAPATSQDVAMLLAAEKGAELIVSVGSHFNLVEFLDKGRKGMSSTFLTRLKIGEIIVDAKGVSRIYHPNPGRGPLFLLLLVGFVAFITIIFSTPGLRDIVELLWLKIQVLLGKGY